MKPPTDDERPPPRLELGAPRFSAPGIEAPEWRICRDFLRPAVRWCASFCVDMRGFGPRAGWSWPKRASSDTHAPNYPSRSRVKSSSVSTSISWPPEA